MEARGIVSGVTSATSLFVACIQCFDIAVKGKSFSEDFEQLYTLFSLQRTRFGLWGESVGLISDPYGTQKGYDTNLDRPDIRPVIESTLNNIRLLLEKVDHVDDKYDIETSVSRNKKVSSQGPHGLQVFKIPFERFKSQIRKSQKEVSPWKVTQWVIHDEAKLRMIIDRLREYVDGLESVTFFLGLWADPRARLKDEIEHISDAESLRLLRDIDTSQLDSVQPNISDTASRHFIDVPQSILEQKNLVSRLVEEDDHSFLTAKSNSYSLRSTINLSIPGSWPKSIPSDVLAPRHTSEGQPADKDISENINFDILCTDYLSTNHHLEPISLLEPCVTCEHSEFDCKLASMNETSPLSQDWNGQISQKQSSLANTLPNLEPSLSRSFEVDGTDSRMNLQPTSIDSSRTSGSERSPMAMDAQLDSQRPDLGRTQISLMDLIGDIQAAQIQTNNLPQIAVVGEQSSGKSSVLESLTGVPFPRAAKACTRYATEIRLRRSVTPGFKVSILPDSSRSLESQDKLRNFGETIGSETSFEQLFHLAKEAITAESTKWASDDKLIVEKSGPNQPPLTLIDLPGFINIANENQSLADKSAIEALTDRYMSNPSTLILAVVDASTDYAVSATILEKTRQHDQDGSRTIGLVTKPDLAHIHGHTEGYLKLINNHDRLLRLALGWNVLLNPPNNVSWPTVQVREQKEREFFSQDGWNSLDQSMCGASTLRSKLSSQLQRQISTHLPALRAELSQQLGEKLKSQAELGDGFDSVVTMRAEITKFLDKSTKLAERAVDGNYIHLGGDNFFDHEPALMATPPQQIRARVVKANYAFAHNLRTTGHSEGFISASGPFGDSRGNTELKKKNYAKDKVTKIVEQNVGTHLPGHDPHQIPYYLFRMHSKKWKDMALAHTVKIKNICTQFVNEVLIHVWPTELQEPLRHHVTMAALEEIHQEADKEVSNMVSDLQYEVPLYDPEFAERLTKWFEERNPNHGDDFQDLTWLEAERLLEESLILYDIIGRSFIRDITVKVVERHFLRGIREIFNSSIVYGMDDDTIEAIAGDDTQRNELRFRLKTEIDKLKTAIKKIDNLQRC